MPHDRDEQAVRVARIDDDLRDLLPVTQAEVRPGLSRVGRLVDAVTRREIGTLEPFTASDVNDVRIRWREGDRSDRSRRLVVEDGVQMRP
jgi:hypothetical protein